MSAPREIRSRATFHGPMKMKVAKIVITRMAPIRMPLRRPMKKSSTTIDDRDRLDRGSTMKPSMATVDGGLGLYARRRPMSMPAGRKSGRGSPWSGLLDGLAHDDGVAALHRGDAETDGLHGRRTGSAPGSAARGSRAETVGDVPAGRSGSLSPVVAESAGSTRTPGRVLDAAPLGSIVDQLRVRTPPGRRPTAMFLLRSSRLDHGPLGAMPSWDIALAVGLDVDGLGARAPEHLHLGDVLDQQ